MTGASDLNKTKNLLVPIFAIQEYWSGLSFLSPEYLPDPVMEPTCPALQVDIFLLSQGFIWEARDFSVL